MAENLAAPFPRHKTPKCTKLQRECTGLPAIIEAASEKPSGILEIKAATQVV